MTRKGFRVEEPEEDETWNILRNCRGAEMGDTKGKGSLTKPFDPQDIDADTRQDQTRTYETRERSSRKWPDNTENPEPYKASANTSLESHCFPYRECCTCRRL